MTAISGTTTSLAGMGNMTMTTAASTPTTPATAAPTTMPGCGGGPEAALSTSQAGTGAAAIGGGTDLASVLASLTAAIKALADSVARMTGGGSHVAGVQGTEAAAGQYVAPTTQAIVGGGSEDSSFEERVLQLINVERAKGGLSAVVYNPVLDQAAEKHAVQMGQTNTMAHEGIGDGDPGERIRAEGFRNAWGENVAVGQTSPEQVVAEWMASPEHKRNIMDPNFKQSGIAQIQAADGRLYWAQEFGA